MHMAMQARREQALHHIHERSQSSKHDDQLLHMYAVCSDIEVHCVQFEDVRGRGGEERSASDVLWPLWHGHACLVRVLFSSMGASQ